MPRGTRLDAPGALHHVMQRGIERGTMFRDAVDYQRFLDSAGRHFLATRTRCVAWALMPNHLHLLLVSGSTPLSRVLQGLFTGYAVTFNHRWRRSGHLFQGRYKSLLCETDPYLLELVRYIHLNPVRAQLCEGLSELARYRWTGHQALMGKAEIPWQDTATVLEEFGGKTSSAREAYLTFCREGLRDTPDRKMAGEGLRRLVEGGWEALRERRKGESEWADERLLGSEGFVAETLKMAEEQERWRSRVKRHGTTVERLLVLAAHKARIEVKDVIGSGKRPAQVKARALACYWLVGRLGYPGVQVARRLGITAAAVSQSRTRGAQLPEGTRAKLSGE